MRPRARRYCRRACHRRRKAPLSAFVAYAGAMQLVRQSELAPSEFGTIRIGAIRIGTIRIGAIRIGTIRIGTRCRLRMATANSTSGTNWYSHCEVDGWHQLAVRRSRCLAPIGIATANSIPGTHWQCDCEFDAWHQLAPIGSRVSSRRRGCRFGRGRGLGRAHRAYLRRYLPLRDSRGGE